MDEANLTVALELLDDFLTEGKAAPVWLVVGGGSALLAQRFGSRQTKDVDVMALREWDGNVVSAHPLPDAVKRAAASVVEELRKRRWTEADLKQRRKTDATKVRMAMRLRRETVMTLDWLAQRLQMGCRHTLANCLKAKTYHQ